MKVQLTDFFTRHRMIHLRLTSKSTFLLLVMTLIFITFATFRWLSDLEATQTSKAIESLLRDEFQIANSYALSKSIADLELLNFLGCAKLIEVQTTQRVFYNTLDSTSCSTSALTKTFFTHQLSLFANNGLEYRLSYIKPTPWKSLFLEALIYGILVSLSFLYMRHKQRESRQNSLRIHALSIEKEMLAGKAKQLKHDVASPLTAFKTIVTALDGLDPRVKSVMTRAIERTEEIINQLQNSSPSGLVQEVDVENVVEEICSEKAATWPSDILLKVRALSSSNRRAIADPVELKRVVSNLLDNAYDAIDSSSKKEIEVSIFEGEDTLSISIADSGKGMDRMILSRIGQRGFSHGKDALGRSGSGLGVYHALEESKKWGGSLNFRSQVGKGTISTLTLKAMAE